MAEAESTLLLDASDFIDEADNASESAQQLSDESEETQSALSGFGDVGDVAAGAITGIGGAMTGAIEGSKDWRETLGRTRVDMGLTQDETENLAQSISNATFPLDDATATMDSLAQQGITTKDSMEEVAGGADNIADATGQTAESVATNLGPAMTSLGDDLDQLPEKQDSFTKAMRGTMLDAPQFSKVIQQNADDLNAMGLNSSEAADLIGAFGEETGLTGRELRQQFREQLQEADGDMQAFQEQTGLTDEELQDYKSSISDSGEMTSQYADSANESLTAMDETKNVVDELSLSFGSLLEPLDAIAPLVTTLAGGWLAFGGVITGTIVPMLTGTLIPALASLALPITAAVAVIAGLYLAWENNFLGIRDITADVVEWIQGKVSEFLGYIVPLFKDHLSTIANEFRQTVQVWWDKIQEFIEWAQPYFDEFLSFLSGLWDEHGGTIMEIVDVLMSTVKRVFEDYLSIVTDIVVGFVRLLRGDFEGVKESVLSIVDTLVSGVVDFFTWVYDKLVGNSIIPDLVNAVVDFITGLKDDAIGLIDEFTSTIVDSAQWLLDQYKRLFTTIYDNTYGRLTDLADDGAGAVSDLADDAVGFVTDMKDDAIGIVDDLASEVVGTLEGMGGDASSAFKSAFNNALPSSVDIPEVTVDNPVPGESGWTIGGGSLDLPSLDTGGMIEGDGLAMLHSGEQVLNAAEVDRREGGSGGGSTVDIEINVDGSGSPEQTARAIERRLGQAGVDAWRS